MSYFVKTHHGEKGPFSKDELRELAEIGKLRPGHFLRRDDGHSFSQAGLLLEELFQDTSEASPNIVAQCNAPVEVPPPIAPDSSSTLPVYNSPDSVSDIDTM